MYNCFNMFDLWGWLLSLSKDVLFQPRMIGQFLHWNPLLRAYFQALLQDIDAGLCYALLDKWIDLIVSCLDGFDSFVAIVAFEGKVAMKHAVKNDSACPNINPSIYFIILLVGKTLRSHIRQATDIQILLCEVTNRSSDTKINNLYLLLLWVNKQYVLKLKIPMYQIILMAVTHALHDLPEKYLCRLLI